MNQLQDVSGAFLYHRQKFISRIETGYSRNAQNSSCSNKIFTTLVRSWMYTAGGKLVQQSRLSKAAKNWTGGTSARKRKVGGSVQWLWCYNCTACEWPQTQKLVIKTTSPSYSYAGKYYLPFGRSKHIGKYQTQLHGGLCLQSSIVRKTGTFNICRT